ncbi:MAG: DUF3754 domain-containing protein [Gemmataceae bacterium]|nr:DUF3754 domain-containing protein [Gemmataceae bacterium]
MAEFTDREHYIPLRKSDLVELLVKDSRLGLTEREPLRQFCKLVGAVWHFEYQATLDRLKDLFAPFDPDADTIEVDPLPAEKKPQRMGALFDEFAKLMERANYKRLSKKDIEAAVEGGSSDWGVNMHVDFDVFERLELFVRGEQDVVRTKPGWLFWKAKSKKVPSYRRLVLLVKLKKSKRLPDAIDTERVYLKVFKDIPKLDLEMVLPGTNLQMPWTQKLKLSGSLIGTMGYGIWSVGAKLVAAVGALFTAAASLTIAAIEYALIAPFVLLAGYGYKQWHGYQHTKLSYTKMLVENLYYQNLDNNFGVVTRLLDEAEDQEFRETVLAWYYLWKHAPAEGWVAGQLDDYVELELENRLELKVDFEIGDALQKLETLGLVTKHGERYRAVPIERALEKLDHRWDNYFQYNKA